MTGYFVGSELIAPVNIGRQNPRDHLMSGQPPVVARFGAGQAQEPAPYDNITDAYRALETPARFV